MNYMIDADTGESKASPHYKPKKKCKCGICHDKYEEDELTSTELCMVDDDESAPSFYLDICEYCITKIKSHQTNYVLI